MPPANHSSKSTVISRLGPYLPWLALIVYWAVLFILTHIPRPPHVSIYGKDKTLHFLAYAILTIVFWIARHGVNRPSLRNRAERLTLLILSGYGAIDEITQQVVGRHGDVFDWLSDLGGIITALTLLFFLRRCRYWLILYAGALFLITHWPVRGSAFIQLPLFWRQFQVAYAMAAYCVLTLLCWRTLGARPQFIYSHKLLLTVGGLVTAYTIIDETFNLFLNRPFDTTDLLSGLGGIIIGIFACILLARHHTVHN